MYSLWSDRSPRVNRHSIKSPPALTFWALPSFIVPSSSLFTCRGWFILNFSFLFFPPFFLFAFFPDTITSPSPSHHPTSSPVTTRQDESVGNRPFCTFSALLSTLMTSNREYVLLVVLLAHPTAEATASTPNSRSYC